MNENRKLPKCFCALIVHLFTLQDECVRNHPREQFCYYLAFFLLHIGPVLSYYSDNFNVSPIAGSTGTWPTCIEKHGLDMNCTHGPVATSPSANFAAVRDKI